MKVALLGSGGQVGNHVAHYLEKPHYIAWAPSSEELNLYDTPLVYDKICKEEPDLIINTAAYTNVDGAERYKELADKVNHRAAQEIAKAAKNLGVPLIHFSTDYVFSGSNEEKYTEDDPTSPLGVYGKTKLDGDEAILAIAPKGIIFRTSWVYDWRRTNFFLKMKFLMSTCATVQVVADQFGIPNSAKLLASKVYEYVEAREFKSVEVVNLVCGEYTSWYQFAKVIYSYLKGEKQVKIIPISTEEYLDEFAKDKLVAMRPRHTILDNSKATRMGLTMPNWDVDFADFIQKPYK